jgi:uncharacterized protein (TIGR02001 family)
MRKLTRALLLAGVLIAGAPAAVLAADAPAAPAPTPDNVFTANVGVYSQYIFRGLTQTNEKPALQGGFDWSHSSGLYAGLWGSNISWISDFAPGTSASLESDFYGGYKPTFGDFFVDVGVLRYQYFGSYLPGAIKPNTTELYLAGGWKTISLKYSHSLGDTFGVCDADGTYYLDLTGSWSFGDFTVLGHAGRQKYKGNCNGVDNNVASYSDYKVEGSYAFGTGWSVGAGYTTTNADSGNTKAFYTPASTNNFIGDDFFYAFLKRTF